MKSKTPSAIVTGGASGIGKACVEILAADGWSITLADFNAEGEAIAGSFADKPGKVRFQQVDVGEEDSVRAMVADHVAAYGSIDGAINSAGIVGFSKPIHEISADEFDRVHRINLRGMFLCIKYECAAMQEKGGAIAAISSAASLKGLPWSSDYCSSKAGVDGLVRGASMDYAEHGIRINAVLPGATNTPLAMSSTNSNPALAKTRTRPMERIASPLEIAEAATWLISEKASFVTGIAMPVDGGMTTA